MAQSQTLSTNLSVFCQSVLGKTANAYRQQFTRRYQDKKYIGRLGNRYMKRR